MGSRSKFPLTFAHFISCSVCSEHTLATENLGRNLELVIESISFFDACTPKNGSEDF